MLALKIALRYLRARKSHNAVNIISVISVAGVAVATMAIVVVLSVFNGFTDLAQSHLSRIDPELKLEAVDGKVFSGADSLAKRLTALPALAAASPVIRERGLLLSESAQMPVVFQGVDFAAVDSVTAITDLIIDGGLIAGADGDGLFHGVPTALAAVGPAVRLQLHPSLDSGATLYVPRRIGRINPANPAASYKGTSLAVTGIFRVDQPEYDADFIIIPLEEARRLLDYSDGEASAIDIRSAPGADIASAVRAVVAEAEAAGLPRGSFAVRTLMEQQSESFRMISVEKWVTFLMLVFILLIASFNVVSTLSLLVIEKRDNMATLRALGATRAMASSVFMYEGWLITAIGGLAGTALGVLLSLVQQHFGLIKLAADASALTIDVYPVRVSASDVALVLMTVLAVGLLIAQIARFFAKNIGTSNH